LDLSEIKSELIFDTYIDKIYPWVKVFSHSVESESIENELVLSDLDFPIYKEWLGNLAIFYVVDVGNNYEMILNRDLPISITNDELHELSIKNLRRDIEYKLHDASFGGYGLIAGGYHEANSICLPENWGWLTEYLHDNLIVAIPSRDLILITPENDDDKVANLKIFVYKIFQTQSKLLTRNIFRFDKVKKNWTIIDTVN
jgi:uncharacterized protein YtpQ (UPF0354 family)